MNASRSTWPIIIGGCHRSGTSLVRRILDSHSRIYCGPEVKFFRDFYGAYLNDSIPHLRFMASARAMLPEADLMKILGSAFVSLHERAASNAGKPRWADKNPENALYLAEWQQLLGESWLFVHIVRNPLDTIASIKEIKFPISIPAGLNERIGFYQQYTGAGLAFGSAHPDRYCRIIYEELVSQPETVLSTLMNWLGEHFEGDQLAFNKLPHQKGLEDPKVTQTQTIHSLSVGRWRSLLTPQEATQISESCGSLWSKIDPESRYATAAV